MISSSIERHTRPVRGAAMTEFLICLSSYAILLFGVILLGLFATGKQEVYKALLWSALTPDSQQLTDADNYFYKNIRHSSDYGMATHNEELFTTEAEMAEYLNPDQGTEEPVMPYKQDDIQNAVILSSFRKYDRIDGFDADGTPIRETGFNSTREGRQFQGMGMVDMPEENQQRGRVDELDPMEVPNPLTEDGVQACEDTAMLVGEWLHFSRAEGGYRARSTAPSRLTGDTGDPDSSLRRERTLSAPSDDPDRFAAYGVTVNEDADRGNHYDDSVRLNDLDEIEVYADELNPTIAPPYFITEKTYWEHTMFDEKFFPTP